MIDDLVGSGWDGWKIALAVLSLMTLPCALFNSVVVFAVIRLGIVVPILKTLLKKSPLKRSTKKRALGFIVEEMVKPNSRIISFLLLQSTNENGFSSGFLNLNLDSDETEETIV